MPLIATKGAASAQGFGEFAQTTAPVYIEDVFSTYLYTGNNSTQTITNGIDLASEGGLVWTKVRSTTDDHELIDTVRGRAFSVESNTTDAQSTSSVGTSLTQFNSNGYSLGTNGSANVNENAQTFVSWTFRKAEKFFDVVTYTGNQTARTISHNLGSVPGFIITKQYSGTGGDWCCYHRSLGASKGIFLNDTGGEYPSSTFWNATSPTSTEFSLGTATDTNKTGATYVAYLFAHDAGGFGDAGSDNVISCGSFTTDGSGNATVTLGYEPQWVMIKASSTTSNWFTIDNMRGFSQSQYAYLLPNTSGVESSSTTTTGVIPTATGFTVGSNFSATNTTYIYIAIRRGPMKTPTSGTSVFSAITRTGTGAAATVSSGFPVDMTIIKNRTDITANSVFDRLRGPLVTVGTNGTYAEYSESGSVTGFDSNTGLFLGVQSGGSVNNSSQPYVNWMFRRAPGFFDEVCYTGNGPGTQTINHNLGVVPELVINKTRSSVNGWTVFQGSTTSLTGFLRLNTNNAQGGDTLTVSSTSITADSTIGFGMNTNGTTYVTYLFASVPGVSKVGRYTGTGTTLQVNCGFTNGSRFVLIKRFDSTGDWYVWDSARGIVAGDDPYLLLNSTAAEVTNTDYVDTYSAGFEISSTAPAAINANGGTFIFLAIA